MTFKEACEKALANQLDIDAPEWKMEDDERLMVINHYIKEHKHLPEGFNQWDLWSEKFGEPIAHTAIYFHCLPEGFNQWNLKNDKGYTAAYIMASFGAFPKWFDQWDLVCEKNREFTVAHITAKFNRLPEGFNQWGLRDKTGWTVAHEAVTNLRIPEGFNQWDLKDNRGWTVADIAIRWGVLPSKTFTKWNLKTVHGNTIFERWLYSEPSRQSIDQFFHWDMVINENGETCRDVYERFKGEE